MRRRFISTLLVALILALVMGAPAGAWGPEPGPTPVPHGVALPPGPSGKAPLRPATATAGASGTSVALGEPGLSFRYERTFGVTGEPYPADGSHLNGPGGLCVDASDSVYVVEEAGLRLLKFNSSGANTLVIGRAIQHWQHEDDLAWPKDVAVEPGTGHIWVTISSALKEFDASGTPLRYYPSDAPWDSGDADDRFDEPHGLAFSNATGTLLLYVADRYNHRVQVFDVSGDVPELVDTIGVSGEAKDDNTGFNEPIDVAFDSTGRLYVLDMGNYRVQRCSYDGGAWSCSTFYGVTGEPGNDLFHMGRWAASLAVDGDDNVYIADGDNYRVLRCNATGTCSHFAGETGVRGSGNDQFGWPDDVAVDSVGNVYVSDADNHRVKKLSRSGTLIGTLGQTRVPYVADAARINSPWGVAVAGDGSIYVAESRGYRLLKLNAAGARVWAVGQAGVYGDDNTHLGNFWAGPEGSLALDSAGRVYVSDTANNRVQIFTAAGAYYGSFGSYGSGANQFSAPRGVAISPANGDIYVLDTDNHRIQVYTSTWGYKATLGVTGEAGSDDAHFDWPIGIAVDAAGHIYVADTNNFRVQKCSLTGTGYACSTFAGETGVPGDDFGHLHPTAVALDGAGRVYVADDWNNRVLVYDGSGAFLTTIAGSWGTSNGQFVGPMGVAVDGDGNVYVSDRDNHRIQKFAPGVPGWRQVNINGFGERANTGLTSLAPFGGRLYAGTYNPDGAQLWRMDTSGAWTQVTGDGFGSSTNAGIDHLIEFDGQLYAGTWTEGGSGGQVWRSDTGDPGDWEQVNLDGFGDASNLEVFRFAVFGGQLYAATWNPDHGGEIWRSATGDPDGWMRVVSSGFGDAGNMVAVSLETFGDRLYAGTYSGEVWRSATGDAGSWAQVSADGFGDAPNLAVSALAAFNGYLYASTITSGGTGAQVWRCQACDGSDWSRVVDGGFGNPSTRSMNGLEVVGSHLYFVVGNRETGLEVWRTANGTSWEQVGKAGLGDSNNRAPYWDNSITVWGAQLYVGTFNDTQAAEVWALLPEVELAKGWNLISLPLVPPDTSPPAVLSSIAGKYDLVYGPDGAGGWQRYAPGASGNSLTEMVWGKGYWIHTTQAAILTVDGTPPASTDISLAPGWNLVGYPGDTAQPAAGALASIAGKYDLVYAYDATRAGEPWQKYNPALPAALSDLTQMAPGKGYWIHATEGCTWSAP